MRRFDRISVVRLEGSPVLLVGGHGGSRSTAQSSVRIGGRQRAFHRAGLAGIAELGRRPPVVWCAGVPSRVPWLRRVMGRASTANYLIFPGHEHFSRSRHASSHDGGEYSELVIDSAVLSGLH